MQYVKIVEQIKDLKWENLRPFELQKLMFLSYVAALEFAEALRVTAALYPDDKDLIEMIVGELKTDNISFREYNQKGDHAEFLAYFLKQNRLMGDETTKRHAAIYRKTCSAFDPQTRAMTIFSREKELSGIFRRILEAKDWSAPGLDAYRYYLERHINLDSSAGGHHDLTKKFPVDDKITPFYKARLDLYRSIPALFE